MRVRPRFKASRRQPRHPALLIGCGLRRAELVALEVDRIQQREGRWVIPDLVGKGNRLRTVTIPAAVKVRLDAWTRAAKISEGWLLQQELSPATINLRLSPLRKLAREVADNGLLDSGSASAIERTQGIKQQGVRAGNWLVKEQANELLNAPDPRTLKGKRDRAILALLICCGLRRAELLRLAVGHIQQREGRWVIPDLRGKGNRLRTVAVPAAVKVRIEEWTVAADIYEGKIFRPVNKADRVAGISIADEKAIWQVVVHYAQTTSLGKLAPHDLRHLRTVMPFDRRRT